MVKNNNTNALRGILIVVQKPLSCMVQKYNTWVFKIDERVACWRPV